MAASASLASAVVLFFGGSDGGGADSESGVGQQEFLLFVRSAVFSPRLQTPTQTQTLAPAAPHIVFMPFRRFGCER